MKNLNKRTKTLLAIAGVVIVVVVAGLVLLGPGSDLFGTTVIHISPENPTMNVGDQLDLSVNSVGNCTWSSSNSGVVQIAYFDPDSSRHATIEADAPGTVTIKANCWANRYTTVTVRTPPAVTYTPAPGPNGGLTLHVGQTMTASVGTTGTNCTWKTVCGSRGCSWYANNSVSLNPVSGPTTTITGVYAGYGTIVRPTCDNGQATGYSYISVVP